MRANDKKCAIFISGIGGRYDGVDGQDVSLIRFKFFTYPLIIFLGSISIQFRIGL